MLLSTFYIVKASISKILLRISCFREEIFFNFACSVFVFRGIFIGEGKGSYFSTKIQEMMTLKSLIQLNNVINLSFSYMYISLFYLLD